MKITITLTLLLLGLGTMQATEEQQQYQITLQEEDAAAICTEIEQLLKRYQEKNMQQPSSPIQPYTAKLRSYKKKKKVPNTTNSYR